MREIYYSIEDENVANHASSDHCECKVLEATNATSLLEAVLQVTQRRFIMYGSA